MLRTLVNDDVKDLACAKWLVSLGVQQPSSPPPILYVKLDGIDITYHNTVFQ